MKKSLVALFHISYWMLYLLIVFMYIMALNIHNTHFTMISKGSGIIMHPLFFAALIPALSGFYIFSEYLFDKFLVQNRFKLFVLNGLVASIFGAFITELLMFIFLRENGINWDFNTCIFMGLFLAFIALAHGITGIVIKGFLEWFENRLA
jgi:hypothetical protein